MISVIIPVYNREKLLESCVDSVLAQTLQELEIILVDDGSTDATPEIAARFPKVRTVRHTSNLGLSVARNSGIERSSTIFPDGSMTEPSNESAMPYSTFGRLVISSRSRS